MHLAALDRRLGQRTRLVKRAAHSHLSRRTLSSSSAFCAIPLPRILSFIELYYLHIRMQKSPPCLQFTTSFAGCAS
jgi:hypothetical protein